MNKRNQCDANKNKADFMKNYGIKFVIPSLYVLNSKIFVGAQSYIIQAVKYLIPKGNKENPIPQLNTHNLDGSTSHQPYHKLYKKYDGNVVLRLIEKGCNSLHMVENCSYILNNAENAIIEISKNGQFIAILYTTNDQH